VISRTGAVRGSLTALGLAAALGVAPSAHAAGGGVDTTFGNGGVVLTGYNGYAPTAAQL